eukprot:1158870-Pelagomonas_calceolata.AAC.3
MKEEFPLPMQLLFSVFSSQLTGAQLSKCVKDAKPVCPLLQVVSALMYLSRKAMIYGDPPPRSVDSVLIYLSRKATVQVAFHHTTLVLCVRAQVKGKVILHGALPPLSNVAYLENLLCEYLLPSAAGGLSAHVPPQKSHSPWWPAPSNITARFKSSAVCEPSATGGLCAHVPPQKRYRPW